jgi:hypothetical protein
VEPEARVILTGGNLVVVAAGAFAEDFDLGANERVEFRGGVAVDDFEQFLIPRLLQFLGDLLPHRGGGGVLAGRVAEDEGIVERDGLAEVAGLVEILVGLAGEADDDVGGDRHARTGLADALGEFLKFPGCVATAHDFQDAVRTALERKVDVLDELGQARRRRSNRRGSRWGAVGEAHLLDAIDRADRLEQLDERAFAIDLGKFVSAVEI